MPLKTTVVIRLMKCWWSFTIYIKNLQNVCENSVCLNSVNSEAWEKSVPKSCKSYGTCWIDHTFTSMKIMLENYGAYISHVESLSQTDSQALKRAELKGCLLKWKHASMPISFAIYLEVLSPLKRLRLLIRSHIDWDVADYVKTSLRRRNWYVNETNLFETTLRRLTGT